MCAEGKEKNRGLGFTLVEVLVAVGVLTVGSLAFLPSFTGANKQKTLTQAVENAKDAMATARNRALTETGNPVGTDTYKFSGVKFTRGSDKYILFRSNLADVSTCQTVQPMTNDTSIKSDSERQLPGGVQAKMRPEESPTCVFFEFGTGNAYTTKGSDSCKSCND